MGTEFNFFKGDEDLNDGVSKSLNLESLDVDLHDSVIFEDKK